MTDVSQAMLPYVLSAAAAFGVVWAAGSIWSAHVARRYNLTRADSGGDGAQPAFLKVNREKRDAAIARGADFDAARAEPQPEPFLKRWMPAIRVISQALALLSLIVGAITAIGRLQFYDEAARDVSSITVILELIQQYWAGFVIVLIVIAAQIVQTIRKFARGEA